MRTTSAAAIVFPSCHLAHVPGPSREGRSGQAAVWICEYPYRTMRLSGPSSDCAGCPVWQAMEHARLAAAAAATTSVPVMDASDTDAVMIH